jgi:N-acetylglucosamine-6-phosphate deacetylase
MIVFAGGNLVLPDRVAAGGSLVVDGGRIRAVESRRVAPAGAEIIDAAGCYVVPGFVDVHVHGVEGHDSLDGGDAIAEIAAKLPRYGVTAFCPTTVACPPDRLQDALDQVRRARTGQLAGARVLPAHLESNFISPEYPGAQPVDCLRLPRPAATEEGTFSGQDVLDVIARCRPDVGIVTLAPELPGGIDLVRSLCAAGHRVSLGHSGADFETAVAAIEAGASHATHLFNRMTPLTHRSPGLAGAVLARQDVQAELICDAYHVHASMCQVAIRAKGTGGVMAITDGTAGSGLAAGASARLGGRPILVRSEAAFLVDGTLAGSTLTMDRAFRNIVERFGGSPVEASAMCSATPARALGLNGFGVLAPGAVADLVVLDRSFGVLSTWIGGVRVWGAPGGRSRDGAGTQQGRSRDGAGTQQGRSRDGARS